MNSLWRVMESADTPMVKAIIIGIVGVVIIQVVHCGNKDFKEDKSVMETKWLDTELEYQWPEVFDTKELGDRPDAALCADGLLAWSNCMAGANPIHTNFGEVMAMISTRLGILGTPESFMEKSKEYTGKP